MTISQTAYDAFLKVLGLRELAFENNMSTQRTQNAVLQALNAEDLANVAALIAVGERPANAARMIEGSKLI